MDLKASSRYRVLERVLTDENAEPTDLPLSLLEDITDRFSPDHEIGRGGFAVVYKGMVRERMVAVKKLSKTYDIMHEDKFYKEVECLMKAKHKNIVRFLGYCVDTQGKVDNYEGKFVMADLRTWLLCFEYVPNGSLDNYITDASRGLEWKERFRIIKGLCEGLHYLHMNHILHLDLKPANVLLDEHMVPKIADFGLSRCLSDDKTHATTKHMSGTPGYFAPESYGGKITFASDIYSLGVVIMEILTGVKGYPEDENVTRSWMNRLEGETQFEQVRVCTKIGKECMESDPKKRPVAWSIIDMLDKTASAAETSMSSLLVVSQASLLEEQFHQEHSEKLDEGLSQEDIEERPKMEDVEERTENDHSQEREGSSWEEQYTRRKVNHKGEGLLSFNSGVLDKLKFWNIFKRDAPKNLVKNNGGQVPVPQISGLTIFTLEEINKITRNYLEMLHYGCIGTFYRGTLPDYIMVAVKNFNTGYRNEKFIKGVEIQAQMIHKNILKLVGYCLEADVKLSVHEYAANGSLQDILHGNKNQMLPIDLRLDVAIGCADGLQYMHSGDIRHGDVNPSNILLDEKFIPKISDFELSQPINVDGSDTRTVSGTRGYICPVYGTTGHLALKSDVYGFGAVLLELITGKKILYHNDDNTYCYLVADYQICYEKENNGRAMFDKKIAAAEDMFVLEDIGKLAMECLRDDIKERPDMMEVTNRLMIIRRDRQARIMNDAVAV